MRNRYLAIVVLALLGLGSPALFTRADDCDADGDGRWITWEWSGGDLTVVTHSTAAADAFADVEVQADAGEGYEFFGGGRNAPWGDSFNGSRDKVCLSTYGLPSRTPVRVVTSYYDRSGRLTDVETVDLEIP